VRRSRQRLMIAASAATVAIVATLVGPIPGFAATRSTGAAPRAVAASLRRAFPDLTLTIEDMTDDGDKVWARIRSTGTHEGPFFGNAATHRRMAIDVIDIARFEDGKMVDHWGVADRLGVLVQLELAPRPGPASEALRSDH